MGRIVGLLAAAAAAAVAAAAFALPAAAAGGEKANCRGGAFSLYVENDLFYNTDRNYTSGVKLTWVSPNIDDFRDNGCVPDWARPVDEGIRGFLADFFSTAARTRNVVTTIGQEIYTPGDRLRTDLIRNDRPYAGWTYLGSGYNERRAGSAGWPERLDSFELRLGMVGPLSLGRWSQDLIHELRGFDKFRGWSNQLRNEPGVQAIFERKFRSRHDADASSDATVHVGASVGNIATYVNAGLEVRFGKGIPDDFGSSPIRPAGNNTSPGSYRNAGRAGAPLAAHLFASLDLRAVARDIFLDGNTFVHSHSVDRRPYVADLALGAAVFVHGLKFSYARVFRTREFEGQASRHSYGSFTVTASFD